MLDFPGFNLGRCPRLSSPSPPGWNARAASDAPLDSPLRLARVRTSKPGSDQEEAVDHPPPCPFPSPPDDLAQELVNRGVASIGVGECEPLGLITNSPALEEFEPEDGNKTIHYLGRWQTTRGDKGPFSITTARRWGPESQF